MNTKGRVNVPEVPSLSLPMTGFLYLMQGEVLAEVEGNQYICYPGHLLLIPEGKPYSIRYYEDVVGYTGGFKADFISRPESILKWVAPLQKAFWFDEAAFVGELFNMMANCSEKGDTDFIARGLDLLLSRIKVQPTAKMPAVVSNFLESVFSVSEPPRHLEDYASEAFVTAGHLNRMVKQATGKSVGSWIGIARMVMAKRLLSETELPVAQIATEVGLDDSSYFSRFFKHQVGMTPLAFRKRMHELS